jgi:uncharacterized protein YqeY
MIHENIKNEIKTAMLAKDQLRLSVVRSLVASFTNELVVKKMKPNEILSDEDALAVIRRAGRQRQDSIEQFRAGGREDLVSQEEAELKIIDAYLPAMMSNEDIKKIVEAKIQETGWGKDKAGQLTGLIMKDLKGKADGGAVKAVVDELLG